MVESADRLVSKASGERPTRNPKRVAAGRLNYQKRRGLSAGGLERIREAALITRPWELSTGPRTAAGKAKCLANLRPRKRSAEDEAVHQDLAAIEDLLAAMAEQRREIVRSVATGS